MVSEREKIEISENFEKKGYGDDIRRYKASTHGSVSYYRWAMHAVSNRGPSLQNIPEDWRTKEHCIAAVLSCKAMGYDLNYSLTYVPEKFKEECANVYQVASSSNSPEQIRNIMKAKFEAARNNPQKQEEALTLMESYVSKFDELRDELNSLKHIFYQQSDLEEDKRERRINGDKSGTNQDFNEYREKLWANLKSETIQKIRTKLKEINEGEAEFITATHICGGNLTAFNRDHIIETVSGTNTWNPSYYASRAENYQEMLRDILDAYSFSDKIECVDKLMEDAKSKVDIYNANLDYFTEKARKMSPKADKQVRDFWGKHIDGVLRASDYSSPSYARRSYLKQIEDRFLDLGAKFSVIATVKNKLKEIEEGKKSKFDAKTIKPRYGEQLEEIYKIRKNEKDFKEIDSIIENIDLKEDILEDVAQDFREEIKKYIKGSESSQPSVSDKVHSLIKRFELVKLSRDMSDEKSYGIDSIFNQEKIISESKKYHYQQLANFQKDIKGLIDSIENANLPNGAKIIENLKTLDVNQLIQPCYSYNHRGMGSIDSSKVVVQDERFFAEKENQLKTILKMIEKEKGVSNQEKTQKAEVSEKETPVVQSVVEESSVESQSKTMKDVEANIIKEESSIVDSSNKNKISEPTLVENEVSSNDTQVERTESVEQSLATEESQEKQNDESEVVLEESASIEKVEEKVVETQQSTAEKIVDSQPNSDATPITVKKESAKKKTESKAPREATLRQKFNVSDEEEFDKLLVHYAQYNKTYYANNGQKKTEEEIRKRKNVNAQFKRILQNKAEREPKNENGEEFSTTIKNIENGQVFSYAELKEVAENKEACLKLFEIMASGVYEKDGQRTRLSQKQRIALASTLEIVSGLRMDMNKAKTSKTQEASKVEKSAQME